MLAERAAPSLYGKPLEGLALFYWGRMCLLNHGETVRYGRCTVTRALWGPWFYVQNGPYRSECTITDGAVHVANCA